MPLGYKNPRHTTGVADTTYPWHLLCYAIDRWFWLWKFRIANVQSVVDALYYVYKRIYCECTAKVQKINENKLFMSSFLGEKSVFVAKLSKWQQKNNRQMVYYTPLDASISVFGNVIVWGSTGESTVNQLTATLNLLKKLMVKRAKFFINNV